MSDQVVINVEANKEYLARLKMLAAQEGISLKRLVRNALDDKYGDAMANFFVKAGSPKNGKGTKGTQS